MQLVVEVRPTAVGAESYMVAGVEVELARDIDFEQLLAAGISQHADQRLVNLDKASVRSGEVEAFLDVVEQLAIATLGFLPVGNILQNVNRFPAFYASGMQP